MPTSIPKVFGIIHICYAVAGGVFSLMGVGMVFLLKAMAEQGGEEFKEMKPLVAAYDGMETYLYVDMSIKLVLAVILVAAGIGLLKRRAWSIKLSVFWAVSRVVIAVGMMLWGLGVSADFQEKLGSAQNAQQEQMQQITQGVGNVVGIVIICIYPVLTVIFLSKKKVRDAVRS